MLKGFTLIEILLALAVMAGLATMSLPVYQLFQTRNDLAVATNTIGQSLRRAQLLAQGVDGDTTWGVAVQSDIITLFKGASFASRDTSYDETFTLSSNITPTGLAEVVFAKLTGLPQTTGTITLTTSTGESKTITINAKGTITYS